MQVEQATDTRQQILSAADEVIRERGLAAATTKAIAERAHCAEGSIYRHFPDKNALLIEIIRSRFPAFIAIVTSLPERAGKATVRKNLETLATGALSFYRGIIPMTAGCLTERKLLEEQRRLFRQTKTGPMKAFGAVTAYLRQEQRLGRISDRPTPEHLTRLLLGACFLQAFTELLVGEEARLGNDEHFAREVVRGLMEGTSAR